MKVRVTVGDVTIRTEGLALTRKQLHELVREAGSIALAYTEAAAVAFEDTSDGKPMGFTAHLELDSERNVGEDLSEWFEESP